MAYSTADLTGDCGDILLSQSSSIVFALLLQLWHLNDPVYPPSPATTTHWLTELTQAQACVETKRSPQHNISDVVIIHSAGLLLAANAAAKSRIHVQS